MDITEEILQSCNNVIAEETSNIISKDNNQALQYEQTHNVMLPPEEKMIAVKISSLKKVRMECNIAKKTKFTFSEMWLGLASLFLGGFLSALISSIPYEYSWLSILSYSICPIGGIGFGVAYFFCRNNDNRDIIQLAEKIEEYILDPEEMEVQ